MDCRLRGISGQTAVKAFGSDAAGKTAGSACRGWDLCVATLSIATAFGSSLVLVKQGGNATEIASELSSRGHQIRGCHCGDAAGTAGRCERRCIASRSAALKQFSPLFATVQERGLFSDSKTFADAVPLAPAKAILDEWRRRHFTRDAELRSFVERKFRIPAEDAAPPAPATIRPSLVEHINGLWTVLTRTETQKRSAGSALPLPYPYVVPGGRFRELYYWDSYFTMLGLRQARRQDIVEHMIVDFGSLIERYGHIPNGTELLSQPVATAILLFDDGTISGSKRRRGGLGFIKCAPNTVSGCKVKTDWSPVKRRDGWYDYGPAKSSTAIGTIAPRLRDEAWREDVALARRTPDRTAGAVYRDVRAAAESGWDFSSRWMRDGKTLAALRTTQEWCRWISIV